MIEVDGIFWLAEGDPGVTDLSDPFSGLTEAGIPRLLREHAVWCAAALVAEGKMFGSSKADTATRDALFANKAQVDPQYTVNMRRMKTQGTKDLERLKDEANRELGNWVRMWREGREPFTELQRDTANWFEIVFSRAFEAGRHASGLGLYAPGEAEPTKQEEQWLKSTIRHELRFWQSFLEEVRRGDAPFADELSPADLLLPPGRGRPFTVEERIRMYLKGVDVAFENGRVSGLPSNLLFYWYGPKPGERGICKGCEYIVERQPYTKDNLPAVPRAGATPCLTNCRHKLVTRKASQSQVESRNAALPKKDRMVKVLSGMVKSRGRFKVKGQLANPWS